MASRAVKPVLYGLAVALSLHFAVAAAASPGPETEKGAPVTFSALESLSLEELDAELQVRFSSRSIDSLPFLEALHEISPDSRVTNPSAQQCPIVSSLSGAKHARFASQSSSFLARAFQLLFPSSHPAVNSLLATLYISGPPNLLLALCPPDIDPASLSVMVAFAVGGLLGDTLFHLLPEIFLGEDEPDRARFILVEPKRNLVLGVAILVGFMTFVAMDKALRIATGGAGGHDHSHGHGHGHGEKKGSNEVASTAVASGVDEEPTGEARARKGKQANGEPGGEVVQKEGAVGGDEREANASIKLGGYLNLM